MAIFSYSFTTSQLYAYGTKDGDDETNGHSGQDAATATDQEPDHNSLEELDKASEEDAATATNQEPDHNSLEELDKASEEDAATATNQEPSLEELDKASEEDAATATDQEPSLEELDKASEDNNDNNIPQGQNQDDIELVESLLPSTGTQHGSVTKRMADGAEVTTYSDGSKTTRMANGTIVINSSDGSKTTTMIPVKGERPDSPLTYKKIERDDSKLGITTTFPDGTSITESDHGKYIGIEYPNGTSILKSPMDVWTIQRDGSSVRKFNDGPIIIGSPYGNTTIKYPDGSVEKTDRYFNSIMTKVDGTKITQFNNGAQITEKTDGTTIKDNGHGSWYITFPKKADGSFKTYYPNGTGPITDINGKIIKKWQDE